MTELYIREQEDTKFKMIKRKKYVENRPQVQCNQAYHRKWLLFSPPRFLLYTFQNPLA